MKRLWRFYGVIALGMTFLAGCGNGQADGISGVQPVQVRGIDIESNGQGGREENGKEESGKEESGGRRALTLGTVGGAGGRVLQSVVEAYNARSEKYYVEVVDYLPERYDSAVPWESVPIAGVRKELGISWNFMQGRLGRRENFMRREF